MPATNSERVKVVLRKLEGKLGNGQRLPELAATAFTERRGKIFLLIEGRDANGVEINADMSVRDIRTDERLLDFLGC